ncbi:MAG TPA: BamA/TamA family outer membrane protein, partial [Methylibium sp.]
RATIAALSLKVEGDLQTRAEAGDVDARELQRRVGAAWPLQPGTPFGQADWSAAKSAVLVQLRAAGYPLAAWTSTAAEVDAAQHSVAITAVADSGPRFHFGELRIEGLSRYDESAIRNLAPFDPGTPYSEQALLDFQERIAKAGLFDSVAVTLEPDAAQASAAPVLVRVRELPKQQATVGVGYSMESGPRLSFEHLQRRPFGLDWQAKTKLQLGRNQSSLSLDLTSHPLPGLYRNLLSGSYTHEVASGVTTNSQQYRVGRTQDTDAIERLYYFEWQHAAINSDGVDSSSTAATLNYEWVWRRLDSNLLPTRGISASAKVGAGRAFQAAGDLQLNAGWFSRASGRVTGYLPLGAQWFGQARLEGAQVFSGPDVAVPYTLLFRAGGDNSVRGYGYQSLGPNNQDGTPAGGHVLATSSIELARPISPKRPAWLGAVFVDAGDAAIDWRSLRPALGYGVGARWRSPAGLLSLDLAYGQRTRKFRLHFNVGVVF